MASPLISVILPSYNHADFVTEAVESVLNQTMRDIELIVVDDGSTDGTPDIVEKIHDPRLKLIRLEQNRLKHPRNLGLARAKGQYVAFQNSDDVWLPQKLELQLKVMQEQRDVVACFTGVEVVDKDGKKKTDSWAAGAYTIKNRSNLQWLQHFFTDGNFLCITSAMVRASSLTQAGKFRESLVQSSDLDLWIRLAGLGQFHIVDERLTLFRDTTDSQTHSGNLSSPSIRTKNRLRMEYASLLINYTLPPVVDLLPQVFPDNIPAEPNSKNIWLAYLAKHSWSQYTVYHALFADGVLSKILDDETARREITDEFGAEIIQEFIKRRSELSINFSEKDMSPEHRIKKLLRTIERRIERFIRY